jgi:hypothetical protein
MPIVDHLGTTVERLKLAGSTRSHEPPESCHWEFQRPHGGTFIELVLSAGSRHLPSVLAPQPERPVRQCPPRFVAGGRRKAQAALHSCGQKRDIPVRPVGYHAYPLRSSSL